MIRLVLTAALVAVPGIALAQADPPQRIRNVQIRQGERCPTATGNEVVVCSTLEQPYRIPSQLRDDQPVTPANNSWVNRAADVDQTSRVAGGLPDTCSPVGTGGQTGCALQSAQAWAADRRARRRSDGSGSQPQ